MADPSLVFSGQISGLEQSILRQYNSAQKRLKPLEVRINDKASLPLGRISKEANNFNDSLGAATNRIVAFGAAAVVLNSIRRGFEQMVQSVVKVEESLTRINVNLGESAEGLSKFSKEIFNIARNTGQTFEATAKAAEELARQGLGAEETLKRLESASILARIAQIDQATAVENLTASINSFSKEALRGIDITNKLVAVDTRFAVSSKDLSEAISRVGSSATEAGVSFDELLAIVTSVQQTTARGGAVIGNAFKTIFTRVQRPEVLQDLEAIGVAVRDLEGNTLPTIQILQNLARTYDTLSSAQKSVVSEQVAGVFQINILKAALGDLNKESSAYSRALGVASGATDEAIRKNEELNKTLASLINATRQSVTEFLSAFANIDVAPLLRTVLEGFNNVLGFLSKSSEEGGKTFGEGILQGISNVLTGPVLFTAFAVISKALGAVAKTVREDLRALLNIGTANKERAAVQQRINALLQQATAAEKAQFDSAKGTVAQKQAILAIDQRITAEIQKQALAQKALQESLLTGRGGLFGGGRKPIIGAAGGFIPNVVAAEKRAVQQGVGGASASAKPVVIPNFNFGGGKKGTIVANSDEYIVPNFAGGGSAIFNKDMARSMGLPNGAKKIGFAGGFVPNFVSPRNLGEFLGAGKFGSVSRGRGRLSDKIFKKFDPSKIGGEGGLSSEYNINKQLEAAGLPVAKVFGSLQRSQARGGIAKEFVGGFGSDKFRSFLTDDEYAEYLGQFRGKFIDKGFNPRDLAYGNILVNDNINNLKKVYQEKGFSTFLNQALGKSVAIDTGLVRKLGAANGYVPNFNDPLIYAIERERKAGVPLNQIYIDKDSRVKGPRNPLGLLVANRRDEPLSGSQGVNRVLSQGGNPKRAGAANGFIPNFQAEFTGGSRLRSRLGTFATKQQLDALNLVFKQYKKALEAGTKIYQKDAVNAVKNLGFTDKSQKQVLAAFELEAKAVKDAAKIKKQQEKAAIAAQKAAQREARALEKAAIQQEKIAERQYQQYLKEQAAKDAILKEQQKAAARLTTARTAPVIRKGSPESLLGLGESVVIPTKGRTREQFEAERARTKGVSPTATEFNVALRRQRSAGQNVSPTAFQGLLGQLEKRTNLFRGPEKVLNQILKENKLSTNQTRQLIGATEALSERRAQKAQGRLLAASFLAPFAAGFIEPGAQALGVNTGGGTTGGKVTGGISGAIQGASLGALLGPQGAIIGGVIGGLAGVFGKLKKSAEELNGEFEKGQAERNAENEAIVRARVAQEELTRAIQEGAPQDVIRRREEEVQGARRDIRTERGFQLLDETDVNAFNKGLSDKTREDERLNALERANLIIQTENIRDFGKTSEDLGRILSRGLPESTVQGADLLKLSEIAGTSFDKPIELLGTTLDEFGVPIDNFAKANEEFNKAASELRKVLDQVGGFGNVEITKSSINGLALAFVRAIAQNRSADIRTQEATGRAGATQRVPRIRPEAFLGTQFGDEDIFRAVGQTRGAAARFQPRQEREQAFLGSLKRLEDLQVLGSGGIKGLGTDIQKAIEASQAKLAREGALETAAQFIKGFQQFSGARLEDERGRLNEGAVSNALNTLSKSGDEQTRILAKILQDGLKTTVTNLENLGVQPERGVAPGGFRIGEKVDAFAGTARGVKTDFLLSESQSKRDQESARKFLEESAKRSDQRGVAVRKAASGGGFVTSTQLEVAKKEIERQNSSLLGALPQLDTKSFEQSAASLLDVGKSLEETAKQTSNAISEAAQIFSNTKLEAENTIRAELIVSPETLNLVNVEQFNLLTQEILAQLNNIGARLSRVEGRPQPPSPQSLLKRNPFLPNT